MRVSGAKVSSLLKTGVVLFCFMCLFFATYMASRYECQKTETEIQSRKVKELEEEVHELTAINKELLRIRTVLAQEKEQVVKEVNTLREKCIEFEDWRHAIEEGISKGDFAAIQQSTDTGDGKKGPFETDEHSNPQVAP